MCNAYVVVCVFNSKHASDVQYSRCHNRARVNVGLSVGIGVTVSVCSCFYEECCLDIIVSLILQAVRQVANYNPGQNVWDTLHFR